MAWEVWCESVEVRREEERRERDRDRDRDRDRERVEEIELSERERERGRVIEREREKVRDSERERESEREMERERQKEREMQRENARNNEREKEGEQERARKAAGGATRKEEVRVELVLAMDLRDISGAEEEFKAAVTRDVAAAVGGDPTKVLNFLALLVQNVQIMSRQKASSCRELACTAGLRPTVLVQQ